MVNAKNTTVCFHIGGKYLEQLKKLKVFAFSCLKERKGICLQLFKKGGRVVHNFVLAFFA